MDFGLILLKMEEIIHLYADGAELKGRELKIPEKRETKPDVASSGTAPIFIRLLQSCCLEFQRPLAVWGM